MYSMLKRVDISPALSAILQMLKFIGTHFLLDTPPVQADSRRGAVNPHGDWDLKVTSLSAIFGLSENDVQLLTMPLFHANAITTSSAGHYGGQTIVIMERFEAEEALQLMEKYRVTFSSMVIRLQALMKQLSEIITSFPMKRRISFDLLSWPVAFLIRPVQNCTASSLTPSS
jgi:acyl-CoA synthetase (AMP-forming)/AMP-acid ligase II